MDADGTTPWGLIIMMFVYAFAGWTVLFAVHYHIRKCRKSPPTARHAALGYGESWKSTRSSDL